jgi:hypothetical protein
VQSGITRRGVVRQRPPLLPPFRPPAVIPTVASTTRNYSFDNHNGSQCDESQPLLSPLPPLPSVTANTRQTVVESQLTTVSGLGDVFTSDEDEEKEEEEREESVARASEKSVARANAGVGGEDDGEDINFFDSDANDDGSEQGMNAFSSGGEFTVNERCSYYMDRVPITLSNRHSVEIVYMVEAETLCRNENTMKLPELQLKIFNRYKSLISAIPSSRFGDVSLKGIMIRGIKNSKGKDGCGSPPSHHTRTREAKTKVQAIMRQIPTISKLPSGRDIIDVRNAFILKEYKAEKGEVGDVLVFSQYTNYVYLLPIF